MMEAMKIKRLNIKVQQLGTSFIEPDIKTGISMLCELLEEAEENEIFEVKVITMTDKEYNKLPEFMGF